MSGSTDREALKRSSDLMLQGWKMLGIICPVCNMALFSKGKDMRCARCDLPVKMADECEDIVQHKHQENAVLEEEEEEEEESSPSYEEMKKQYAERRRQSDAVSEKVGKKLLQGWIMLGDQCSNEACCFAPLMKKVAADKLMLCPACESEYTVDDLGAVIVVGASKTSMLSSKESTNAARVEPLLQGPVDLSAAPFLAAQLESDSSRNSQKISQLLMKGWAMLGESCECNNNAPLLRDRCGKVYCIDCGYLAQPGHAAQEEYEYDNDKNDDDDSDKNDEDEDDIEARLLQLAQRAFTPKTAQFEENTASKTAVTRDDVVSHACKALEQRLARAAAEVATEKNLKTAKEQAELVQHIAAALQSLAGLKRTLST